VHLVLWSLGSNLGQRWCISYGFGGGMVMEMSADLGKVGACNNARSGWRWRCAGVLEDRGGWLDENFEGKRRV